MKGIFFKTWPAKLRTIEEFGRAQTRRVEKSLEIINQNPDAWECLGKAGNAFRFAHLGYSIDIKPRYRVGEIAYVKEAWKVDKKFDNLPPRDLPLGLPLIYPFGGDPADEIPIPDCYGRLRSPLYLREEDARYFVLMLVVKPQRVQDITEEDAIAEGCRLIATRCRHFELKPIPHFTEPERDFTYKDHFIGLWDSINPKYLWELNPWEFTYTIERSNGIGQGERTAV